MSLRIRIGRRWRSVSFRSGLVAALSVGIVASVMIFMLMVVGFVLFVLTGGVAQASLLDRASDQLLLGVAPADVNLETSLLFEEGRPGDVGSDAFWALVAVDGAVLNSAGAVNEQLFDAEFKDVSFVFEFDASLEPEDLIGFKSSDGRDWFYFERAIELPDGPTYRVITAYDGPFTLWGFAQDSFPVTIPAVLTLMTVAMIVTSWLTRRALRRVEHMRAEVEQITQHSLDRRVPVVSSSDDIEKLGHTMNDMLGMLESSNTQQTQFLADASHELRSPVAGLLAQLDVATSYPDKVDSSRLLPKLRDEAERLQLLVDDLLFLSRAESHAVAGDDGFTLVAVDALIAAEVELQKNIDEAVEIVVGDPSGVQVWGNPRDLERAVRNLVGNAVRHCRSEVRLDVRTSGSDVVIRVSDDGPGIADEDADRIFKRFVRLDEARTRDAGGSGLGLSIVSEIASNHGGTIELVHSPAPGATFELTLSRVPDKVGKKDHHGTV